MDKLEKLPKWAQEEIKRSHSIISILEKKLSEINGEGETNVFISNGLSKSPLPNNSNIEFKTGKNNMNTVSVYIKKNGDIDINTDSRLGQDMIIRPNAANSFYISFIDR